LALTDRAEAQSEQLSLVTALLARFTSQGMLS
jgi:hypothetical protein